jgi:hypothetical protein
MRSQADTSANDRLYPPERGVQASTTNNRVAEVKKFYDTNDIELRWKKIKSYTGRRKNRRSKRDRSYTYFEIIDIHNNKNMRQLQTLFSKVHLLS